MGYIIYIVYTFVPLGRFVYDAARDVLTDYESNKHADNRKKRISIFLNAYGIDQPKDLISQIVLRLEALCNTLIAMANDDDEAFKKMISEG